MTSAHDDSSCDDTSSSLGDSSYDFIDDRSNVTTDDEDQDALTESTTSSDGLTFEQVDHPQRNRPSDSVNQPFQGYNSPSSGSQQGSSPSDLGSAGQVLGLSGVADSEAYHGHEAIEFDEPSITNLKSSRFTEVSHTLRIVEKQDQPNELYKKLLDRLQGQLAVTVRQTMTCPSLAPEEGQYKVMYVGDPQIREPIIQKIGTALAATLKCMIPDSGKSRSSKFNIVPISAFGEETSPEVVLIDSSGLELTVEDCSYASFVRKEGGNDSLRLNLSNGVSVESTWTGSEFAVSNNWKLPDVAIFCLPDNDNFALKKTRQFARSFMSRHKVLSIIISQSPLWDKPLLEPMTLDYLTPHICLESRKSSLVHAQIIRRFPVDVNTFLNIDAGQMNRNLACLAVAPGSSKSRQRREEFSDDKLKNVATTKPWAFRDVFESLVSDVKKEGLQGLNRYEYIAGLVVVLMSLFGMMVVGLGLSELLGASKVSNSGVFPMHATKFTPSISMTAALSSTVPVSLSSVSTLAATSASSSPSHVSPVSGLSTNTDLASFLLDAYTGTPNKSEQFKIHVLGDRHIVLRPPHWFSKLKKTPKLGFKVSRSDAELEHQITTLFDGVYALQIPREDAYGILNVAVWTKSKPMVNETFEVDFGSSWLKVAGWKKATRVLTESIRGDLQSVQTSLGTVYDHTKTGLSTFLQQQKRKVAVQKRAEKAMLETHLKAAAKTKELIIAQTKDLIHCISKSLGATRAATSAEIKRKAGNFAKDLTFYARNRTSSISHKARVLSRAATVLDVKALAQGFGGFRRRHLRASQKNVLKVWWKVSGAPKQKKIKVKVKGPRGRTFIGDEL